MLLSSKREKTKQTRQILKFQTKPALGKHSTESLHAVIRQLLVFIVPSTCSGSCVCVREGANADCSLDYSDMGQYACAGSEITVAVSSDVRHGFKPHPHSAPVFF